MSCSDWHLSEKLAPDPDLSEKLAIYLDYDPDAIRTEAPATHQRLVGGCVVNAHLHKAHCTERGKPNCHLDESRVTYIQ